MFVDNDETPDLPCSSVEDGTEESNKKCVYV